MKTIALSQGELEASERGLGLFRGFLCSLAFFAIYNLLLPCPAQAYIDPSTGSILLQLLLGGVAGIAVLLKLFWARLRRLFGRQGHLPQDGKKTNVDPDA